MSTLAERDAESAKRIAKLKRERSRARRESERDLIDNLIAAELDSMTIDHVVWGAPDENVLDRNGEQLETLASVQRRMIG